MHCFFIELASRTRWNHCNIDKVRKLWILSIPGSFFYKPFGETNFAKRFEPTEILLSFTPFHSPTVALRTMILAAFRSKTHMNIQRTSLNIWRTDLTPHAKNIECLEEIHDYHHTGLANACQLLLVSAKCGLRLPNAAAAKWLSHHRNEQLTDLLF